MLGAPSYTWTLGHTCILDTCLEVRLGSRFGLDHDDEGFLDLVYVCEGGGGVQVREGAGTDFVVFAYSRVA